ALNWMKNLRLADGTPPRMDLYGHNPFTNRMPDLRNPPLGNGFADFSDLKILARWVDRYLGRAGRNRKLKLFLAEFSAPTDHANYQFNFHVTRAVQAKWATAAYRIADDWSRIEVSPDTYDFDTYDAYVGDAARAGLSILPIVFRAPDFRGGGASTHASPPTKYDDIGTFAAVLVRRYGPNGSFWSENPDI